MGFLCLRTQPQIPRMGMKRGFIETHENCLFFLIFFSKRYSILGIGSSSLCQYITFFKNLEEKMKFSASTYDLF